jgi:VanZ family protein
MAWGPAVAMMAIIFIASSIPDVRALPGGFSDKSWHSMVYALLGAMMLRGFARARWTGVTLAGALAAVALSVLYGVSDEWHQSFVPGRSPDVYDVGADAAGATIGVAAAAALAFIVRRWGIVESPPRPERPE